MEQGILNENYEEHNSSNLIISGESMVYLAETAKWTKFISIFGFILIGIFVIFALFAGTFFSNMFESSNQNMPSSYGLGFTFMYLLLGLLYFFPLLYLFRFSQKSKSALISNSNEDLTLALRNQKSLYKFMGIFTIVILSSYLIFGLGMLVFSSFLK